ncbi:MAG: PEGA domain-containing protein [Myxococcota bacterium]
MRSHIARSLQFFLTFCLVVGGFASPAFAQDSDKADVAVLNLEGDNVDDQLLKTLTAVLRNEAQKRDDFDVNQSSITLSEVLVVLGCGTPNPTCLKQAAEQVDAEILVYGSVEKKDERYEVDVEVFDAAQKEITQRVVRTLKTDDPVVEFREQVRKLFVEEPGDDETRVQIGSNVEGAKIRIKGTVVGTTPLERKGLPPGRYDIEVFADGYTTWKARIELEDGSDIRLWAPLDEKASPQASSDASSSTAGDGSADGSVSTSSPPEYVTSKTNWGAWSAVGVGGLSLAGSGVMAFLMSNTQTDLETHYDEAGTYDDAAAWERRRNELIDQGESYELAHRVLLGVGAVSLTTGIVWLLLDDTGGAESANVIDVHVSPTGASATFRW